jgi:hypothetical protein
MTDDGEWGDKDKYSPDCHAAYCWLWYTFLLLTAFVVWSGSERSRPSLTHVCWGLPLTTRQSWIKYKADELS